MAPRFHDVPFRNVAGKRRVDLRLGGLLTQRRAVKDVVFPGKLLYYMAAGRPLLAAVSADSETGTFITQQGVGVVTPPEDATALAAAIVELQRCPPEGMGRQARATVARLFDKRIVLPAFADELEAAAKRGS